MMTINDQIKDEKLQYDINREAAKISALSSGKLHKYEHLSGEDILPSNQQQIIKQTKFIYSRLGKAFDKQIKIIEDQGKKHVDALEILKPIEGSKAIKYDDESLKQRQETYNKLFDEKLDEKQELSREIDYKNLNYDFTTKASAPINFTGCNGPFTLFKKIRDGEISLEMAEEDQKKFKRKYGQIKLGNSDHKSGKQLCTINNVKNLYDSRQKIIYLFNSYSKIRSEAIYKSKQNKTEEKGLKILAPKQMLQRLPIALAQVTAGNNSQNLLNEIRQIIYSLYQSKQITKKVYNNLMKSL